MAGIIDTLKAFVMGKEAAPVQKEEKETKPAEPASKQDQLTQAEKEAKDKRFEELKRKQKEKGPLVNEKFKKYGLPEDKER